MDILKKLLALLLLSFVYQSSPAQIITSLSDFQLYNLVHRPDQQWYQLDTEHFNIIFPEGEDSTALATASILEQEYDHVQQLTGGGLNNFPVILNNYTDLSNGFVQPLNFRMEIVIPPVKGKILNPRSGSWLESVLPHELVHAMHINHLPWLGLSGFVKPFSPDLARSLHSIAPLGIHEGLAVYHETQTAGGEGGRGNFPYFTRTFSSIFSSSKRWSMGQMVHFSSNTHPSNRHYIGGYMVTDWLHHTYGDSTSAEAIDFFARLPILGYGVSLLHTTGEWPATLYDQFVRTYENKEKTRITSLKKEGLTPLHPIPLPFNGAETHHPLWTSNNTLIFHGSFYNSSSGFYLYNLTTERLKKIHETQTVENRQFDLTADSSRIVYANYHAHPIYENTYTSDLYYYNFSTSRSTQLTRDLRGDTPAIGRNRIWAIQNHHASTRLITLTEKRGKKVLDEIYDLPDTRIIDIAPRPGSPDTLAVVARREGLQALWITKRSMLEQKLARNPDIAFQEGSVFNPSWSAEGDKLLISSDFSNTFQIYEYLPAHSSLIQITNHPYNAFEASYSPRADKISYVIQHKNERIPAILDRKEFLGREIPSEIWSPDSNYEDSVRRAEPNHNFASRDWGIQPYSDDFSWLRPRAFFPIANSDGVGVQISSVDRLRENAYTTRLTYGYERLWYDMEYRHSGFYPGFEINFSEYPLIQRSNNQKIVIEGQQASLKFPFDYILKNNVEFSSFSAIPAFNVTRLNPLQSTKNRNTGRKKWVSTSLSATLNYQLQQNMRDIQPNSGAIFRLKTAHDLYSFGRTPLRHGLHIAAYQFMAPLKQYNQSLRVGTEIISQTKTPVFSTRELFSEGFKRPVLPDKNNLLSLNTRYTIPLWYPDDGGFLIPGYVNKIYLVAYSETVTNLNNRSLAGFTSQSRSVFGSGVRTTFRFSNLTFDIGISLAFEPSRGNIEPFIGDF